VPEAKHDTDLRGVSVLIVDDAGDMQENASRISRMLGAIISTAMWLRPAESGYLECLFRFNAPAS
jgi:hypothetical protein